MPTTVFSMRLYTISYVLICLVFSSLAAWRFRGGLVRISSVWGLRCPAGLPVLIFLGLDAGAANGTNRIALLIQNISAVASFRKRKVHQYRISLFLSLLTLPGAVAGAIVATRISSTHFQRILGVILILVVISMFFSRSYKDRIPGQGNCKSWLIYPAFVGIGFYGGFVQLGVGFLLMGALYHLLRIDLVLVNAHKVFIVLVYTIPALLVFAITGNVNWKYGLVLAAGNAAGAWWGAHAAVKGGEKVIRIVVAVAVTIMALRLFGLHLFPQHP